MAQDPICKAFQKLERLSDCSDLVSMTIESPLEILAQHGEGSPLIGLAQLFGAGCQHLAHVHLTAIPSEIGAALSSESSPASSTSALGVALGAVQDLLFRRNASSAQSKLCSVAVEFPLFRCWRSGEGSEHLIAFRAVQHPKFESSDGAQNVRLPTGWVVQPMQGGGCHITYILLVVQSVFNNTGMGRQNIEDICGFYFKSLRRLHQLMDPSVKVDE
mmetsp:Transcript_72401/g.188322  ORF Transcript_72401/g.188322 Transcript_72401/m.188322 type:complete len:217 (+) Transcript_72401:1-651(+)